MKIEIFITLNDNRCCFFSLIFQKKSYFRAFFVESTKN